MYIYIYLFIIIYNRVLTVELNLPSSKESLRIYGYKVTISGRYTATKNGIPLSCTVQPYKYLFLSNEGPTLEMLNYTICIGSTVPTFLYFNLYLYSAYAAHYVYFI